MKSRNKIIPTAIIALAISSILACSHFSDGKRPNVATEDRTYTINRTQTMATEEKTVASLTNEHSTKPTSMRSGTADEQQESSNADTIRDDGQAQPSRPEAQKGTPIQDNEDSNGDDNHDELPAGYLPDWIQPGSLKNDLEAITDRDKEIIVPDAFGEITRLHKKNTARLHARFGNNRIIMSQWIDGIIGINRPRIIWGQAKCEMENTATNYAATLATDVSQEVVFSGIIDYESSTFLMTNCRIHGIYCGRNDCQSGFQHALAPNR